VTQQNYHLYAFNGNLKAYTNFSLTYGRTATMHSNGNLDQWHQWM